MSRHHPGSHGARRESDKGRDGAKEEALNTPQGFSGISTRIKLVALLVMTVTALLAPPSLPAASAGTPLPAVWIGTPTDGTWPNANGCAGAKYPSASCSLPFAHHTFFWGNPYKGDFGFDEQNVAHGAGVYVYAAPQNTSTPISAYVQDVRLACSPYSGESYAQTRARGGHAVVIAMYSGGTKIGTAVYVHVDARVSKGQWINRWGTLVGTVGTYYSNGCWTGRHIHIELLSMVNYACYNKGFAPGQKMYRTNFIGFIGGSFATSGQKPCP